MPGLERSGRPTSRACLGFLHAPAGRRRRSACGEAELRRRAVGGTVGRRGRRADRRRRLSRPVSARAAAHRRGARRAGRRDAGHRQPARGRRRRHRRRTSAAATRASASWRSCSDSRNGTFGVVALVDGAAARPLGGDRRSPGSAMLVALVAAMPPRARCCPAFMQMVTPARTDGLSAGIGAGSRQRRAGRRWRLGVLALLPLGLAGAVVAAVLLWPWCCSCARWLTESQIGGQTGDVLGALQQAGEIVVLFVVACPLFARLSSKGIRPMHALSHRSTRSARPASTCRPATTRPRRRRSPARTR